MNKYGFLLSKQARLRQKLDVQVHSSQELEVRKLKGRLRLAETSISSMSPISYSQVWHSILSASAHCLNLYNFSSILDGRLDGTIIRFQNITISTENQKRNESRMDRSSMNGNKHLEILQTKIGVSRQPNKKRFFHCSPSPELPGPNSPADLFFKKP